MTNYLKQIKKVAAVSGSDVTLGAYNQYLPDGYFDVIAKIFDINTIFVLRGERGQDAAEIVGRIEMDAPYKSDPTAYFGDLLRSHQELPFHTGGIGVTLAMLVEYSERDYGDA